jgi:hypothetical protein
VVPLNTKAAYSQILNIVDIIADIPYNAMPFIIVLHSVIVALVNGYGVLVNTASQRVEVSKL